jgi:outer membrane protein assembly factor BamE (lipoprotein component of BamABCDE complex)
MLTGCIAGGASRDTVTGRFVGAETLSNIEPGTTTKSWVVGALGEPSTKTVLPDGLELWTWNFSRTKRGTGWVLFIFSTTNERETSSRAFVEFRHDVVTRAWREDDGARE